MVICYPNSWQSISNHLIFTFPWAGLDLTRILSFSSPISLHLDMTASLMGGANLLVLIS